MENWHTIAQASDLQPGEGDVYEVEDEEIALFNVDGDFKAIGNICTHAGGPLAEGELRGNKVECPWHGAQFDCDTGEALTPPAMGPVDSYDLKIEDGVVKISL